MKHRIFFSIFFLAYVSICWLYAKAHTHLLESHTFLRGKPPFLPVSAERLAQFHQYASSDAPETLFQVVGYVSHSTSPNEITNFFLPYGKIKLRVVEYKPGVSDFDSEHGKDIEARHFNIKTASATQAFQSVLSFCPEQVTAGIAIDAVRALVCDEEGRPRWWVGFAAPLAYVRQSMGIQERVTNDGGGAAEGVGLEGAAFSSNMISSLNQAAWQFGKMPQTAQAACGLSCFELKIGRSGCLSDSCSHSSYLGVSIPLGNKPQGIFVFEPIFGDNQHAAILWGSTISYQAWGCTDHSIRVTLDICNRYGFGNEQVRSFDLRGKPWSRYMAVYESPSQAQAAAQSFNADMGRAGINVFTRPVHVNPRFSTTLNTAFSYAFHCLRIDAGFNLFARQAEYLSLCRWPSGIALKAIEGVGATTIAATIRDNFPASIFTVNNYHEIRKEDIDLASATQPATLHNTIYASIGYAVPHSCDTQLLQLCLGGAYEFSHVNAIVSRFMLFAKAVIVF